MSVGFLERLTWLPPAGSRIPCEKLAFAVARSLSGNDGNQDLSGIAKMYLQAEYVLPVSSGRAGLTMILSALQEKESTRKYVIIPAYTCVSVAASVIRAGLRIRLCDLDPWSFDYNVGELELLCGEDVLAVVVVHPYGLPVEVKTVMDIAREKGIYVIEDAAQALGTRVDGHLVGNAGDVSFFSLGKGKSISSIHGGIIASSNKNVIRKLEATENFLGIPGFWGNMRTALAAAGYIIGSNPYLYGVVRKIPFLGIGQTLFRLEFRFDRLDSCAAWLAYSMLGNIESAISRRRMITSIYLEHLRGEGIVFPKNLMVSDPAPIRLPIFCMDDRVRKTILGRLEHCGISESYPLPLDRVPALQPYLLKDRNAPCAYDIARSIITLPTHFRIGKEDAVRIAEKVSDAAA